MRKYLLRPDDRSGKELLFADRFYRMIIPQDTDYRPKLPPVWDQGDVGACQSYAIDAIDQYLKGYTFTPAHLFTYYNTRLVEGNPADEDTGGTLKGTCQAVRQYGICDSAVWPNDNVHFADKPSDAAYKDGLAGNDTIMQYYRVQNIDEIRQALAMGKLPYIGIKVYESFEAPKTLKTGIIPAPAGAELGGHALVISGHHDNVGVKVRLGIQGPGYVIIRNSWGAGVGKGGYFTADYAVLEKLLMDMWVIVR